MTKARNGRMAHLCRMTTCALLAGLWAANATAATVRTVGTVDLAAKSGFIFHGKPVAKWVAAGQKPGSIYTYVRYQVMDVLKGDKSQQSVVLSFLGGTLNGRTLRVEGMKLPTVGDEGVFFVSELGRNYVQPFYGWDQGQFRVRTDAQGHKTVFTQSARPVRRVDSVRASHGIATGEAAGIVVSADERDALPLESFKARVIGIVEAQQ